MNRAISGIIFLGGGGGAGVQIVLTKILKSLCSFVRSLFRHKSCLFDCGSVQDRVAPSGCNVLMILSVTFLAGKTRKMRYFRSRKV